MAENQPIIIKKKKAGGHGSHGGAWKIAYADLVTAMMAFFLVMWIIGLDEKTKVGIAEYFNNPSAYGMNKPSSRFVLPLGKQPQTTKGQLDKNEEPETNLPYDDAKRVLATTRETVQAEGSLGSLREQVVVAMGKDGLRIELADSGGASFFTADGQLRPEGRKAVERVAPILINTKSKIDVQGHAEARPGQSELPWRQGSERAGAVVRALTAAGFPGDRIHSVVSYGATQLRSPQNPTSPANRRVIILVPFKIQYEREASAAPAEQ
jgi:chemotaxis protein MotB